MSDETQEATPKAPRKVPARNSELLTMERIERHLVQHTHGERLRIMNWLYSRVTEMVGFGGPVPPEKEDPRQLSIPGAVSAADLA